jgi:alpha-tubulin suppressor-like RCC1 family protein
MATRMTSLVLAVLFLAIGVGEVEAGLASRVAAGGYHTCAMTTTGAVICWGANAAGRLGDGTTTQRLTPTPTSGLGGGAAAIAPGFNHTCALTTSGGVMCWGDNYYGQLGDGTTTDRLLPTFATGLGSGVAMVAAGDGHTCAVTTGGAVMCGGWNWGGQVGNGTTADQSTLVPVIGLGSGVATVATGGSHTCARTTGGGVMCWGSNTYGELGDGTVTSRTTPTAVSGLGSGVAAIAGGYSHTCGLLTAGSLMCWGSNFKGQLGDGTVTYRTVPTAVTGLGNSVVAVAAGHAHTCALRTDGSVVCWGLNDRGQLGDGTTTDRTTPTAVAGLASYVVAITAGEYHTCALTLGGTVVCWGANSSGQLGDGTTTDRHTPTLVSGLGGILPPSSDFNGNWQSDILWRHVTHGDVWVWLMDSAGKSLEVYLRTVGEPGWEIRGQGDQNADGRANILWRHASTGMLYLWSVSWYYTIPLVREDYIGTVDPAYDVVGTGDYNGDGKSDILWRHKTNGELWVWLMNGATALGMSHVATIDPVYEVVGSGDLNGDGKADILWRHKTNGEVWVWLMNGATPTSMALAETIGDLGYQIVGVADYTVDGKADILWRHNTRGEVWLWPMNGTKVVSQSYVGTVPDTGYGIVGSGDYNGDGKADIVWHHATRGEVWVWPMNGTAKLSETYIGIVPDTGYQVVK